MQSIGIRNSFFQFALFLAYEVAFQTKVIIEKKDIQINIFSFEDVDLNSDH